MGNTAKFITVQRDSGEIERFRPAVDRDSDDFAFLSDVSAPSVLINRAGLSTARPAASAGLTGVTWTYTDVGSATYTGRVDRCDGTSWVMIVPPVGTWVSTTAVGSGSAAGRTVSALLSGAPTPSVGSLSLRLTRSDYGNPLTISWWTGAQSPATWEQGLDNLTNDMVFINDPLVGDQIRYGKGGHLLSGLSVASPATTYRSKQDTVVGDDPTMVDNMVLTSNTALTTLLRLFRAFTDAGEIFTVSATRTTAIGIGTATPSQFIQASLGQNATTQFVLQNLTAGTLSRASLRVQSDGRSAFLEAFSSLFTTGTWANNAMLYTNNGDLMIGTNSLERARWKADGSGMSMVDGVGLIFGTSTGSKIGTAATQKWAAWGATPDVQPVISYSRSGAGETAACAAIRGALAARGLISDLTTA